MTTDLHDLALIGNSRVAAAVNGVGEVVRACLPRFDSDALCCSLLNERPGNEDYGFASVDVTDFARSEQQNATRSRAFAINGAARRGAVRYEKRRNHCGCANAQSVGGVEREPDRVRVHQAESVLPGLFAAAGIVRVFLAIRRGISCIAWRAAIVDRGRDMSDIRRRRVNRRINRSRKRNEHDHP
jgi:hypothetical protein